MRDLLSRVNEAGIRLEVQDGSLRVVAPRGSLTDELRQDLRENSQQIVAMITSAQGNSAEKNTDRLRVDTQEKWQPFPLTGIQNAYWLGRQGGMELGGVSTHNYFEIHALNLDIPRFNEAFNRLIVRHDMLRAVVDENGVQRILPSVPTYDIKVDDFSRASADEADEASAAIRASLSHQVLPADRWPLFEVRIVRRHDGTARIHFSLDFLFVDAWSAFLIFREWRQVYEDQAARLPDIDISFRDYVLHELAQTGSPAYERARNYWIGRVDSIPGPPELPLVARREAQDETPSFKRRRLRVDEETWRDFKEHARGSGLTPSGALLALFSEVLSRWSSTPHFTLNLTLFNRSKIHEQVERLVGDFTSLLLVEVDFRDRSLSFSERAKKAQTSLLDGYEHAAMSGMDVMREWSKRRGSVLKAAMPVVFTSTLGLNGENGNAIESFGEIVYGVSQTPQVWLDHQVIEVDGDLICNWDCVDELFEPGVLDDMFEAFGHLIAQLAGDRGMWHERHLDFPCVGEDPQTTDRADDTAHADHVLLHELFERTALATPSQPAVIGESRSLDYDELRQRSVLLAERLQALGCQPNRLVAIVMDKGWEQVVGALGILYAGAAYLPLDASLPQERLEYLLRRSDVRVALTQSASRARISLPESITCIDVDLLDALPSGTYRRPASLTATDLAYVIYTSGSTGQPKGVMIDHRGAVNTVLDINERFGVGAHDRVLALSSLSFDLSVYDVFGILAAGGALVLPSPHAARDPGVWLELAKEHRVTVWNSVPALLEMMLEYAGDDVRASLRSMRLILLSGDWVPLTLPSRVKGQLPDVEFVSLGGATEASIWSIFHKVSELAPWWKSIPYGMALSNQSCAVLDDDFQRRPTWVAGPIYIGGLGLAKGYWLDPDATSRSFKEHPRTAERLYRTGDVGRYLPDGSIELLGREDFQVKVQGHRVELGEIETAMETHPSVRSAVANTFLNAGGEKRLAVFFVPKAGCDVTPDELEAFLAGKLPRYMIPSVFEVLPELPLSSNGKVDRKALPALNVKTEKPKQNASLQSVEEHIARIVRDFFGFESLEMDQDFFSLGASSIDLVRIRNALFAEIGFRPSLSSFILNPSIAGLIQAYRSEQSSANQLHGRVSEDASGDDVIGDPAERRRFKSLRLGDRSFEATNEAVDLARESADGERFDMQRWESFVSTRRYSKMPIAKEAFSYLLFCLSEGRVDGNAKFLYPSAGGLYPVQTYVYLKPHRVDGLEGGAYYYDRRRHKLVRTAADGAITPEVFDPLINRPVFDDCAFSLFFIASLGAIQPMYGSRSEDHCKVEAGAMAQVLRAAGPEVQLGLCGIGDLDATKLSSAFGLESGHIYLYSMLGGGLPERAPIGGAPLIVGGETEEFEL